MVVNGATKEADLEHFRTVLARENFTSDRVQMEYMGDSLQLLAVQGPAAADAVQKLVPVDLSKMPFMSGVATTIDGIDGCRVTRCVPCCRRLVPFLYLLTCGCCFVLIVVVTRAKMGSN